MLRRFSSSSTVPPLNRRWSGRGPGTFPPTQIGSAALRRTALPRLRVLMPRRFSSSSTAPPLNRRRSSRGPRTFPPTQIGSASSAELPALVCEPSGPPVQLLVHRPPAQPAVEQSWSRHLSAPQIGLRKLRRTAHPRLRALMPRRFSSSPTAPPLNRR